MPELPEVETIRRALDPLLRKRQFSAIAVRQPNLRVVVRKQELESFCLRPLGGVRRRGKYLLITPQAELTLLIHLGMSGSFALRYSGDPVPTHEHVYFQLDDGRLLGYSDPRRFGRLEVFRGPAEQITPLIHLGPEPLSAAAFSATSLWRLSQGRKVPIKSWIMDQRVVVGVGNIYAAEALFRSRIHPARASGRISLRRYEMLVGAIRSVLSEAIDAGGTTLQDHHGVNGEEGLFYRALQVYGRAGQPCPVCGTSIDRLVLAGRSSFYCPYCQR